MNERGGKGQVHIPQVFETATSRPNRRSTHRRLRDAECDDCGVAVLASPLQPGSLQPARLGHISAAGDALRALEISADEAARLAVMIRDVADGLRSHPLSRRSDGMLALFDTGGFFT